nr:transcription factor vrtr1 [Quercus suber]
MYVDDLFYDMDLNHGTASNTECEGDKRSPVCSTCSKAKPRLECIYQAPAPRKRKRRPADDVHDRLDRYESLLKTHGLLSKADDPPSPQPSRPGIDAAAPAIVGKQPVEKGRLIATAQSGKRYVESHLWKDLSDDDLEPSSDEGEDDDDTYRGVHATDPLSASILGPLSPMTDLINLHPTYEAACKMWQLYVDRIDPICKILHLPTGYAMVQRSAANPSSVSRRTEVLLFAIYHFAIRVLTDAECDDLFRQRRNTLLSSYHDAFRQSLVNASFLRSTDFQTLQAYTLFLLSIRGSCDPQTFWILTGIAVRMGQRIGLHRDGEDLGLDPFDVQMRRRLFWQLSPLDGMASNMCGTGMMGFGEWGTRQPLNVEDEDLHPGMTTPPVERKGATGMIFCAVRSYFHLKRAKTWQVDRAPRDAEFIREALKEVDELESSVEDRFLKYCDPFEPVHCLASAMARGGLTFARMRLQLPRSRKGGNVLPLEKRRQLFDGAAWFVTYMSSAFRNELLIRFRWHFSTFFQWEPMVWVLSEIRLRSPVVNPDTIWATIERTYEDHPELLSRRRALHIAVGKLTIKAWAANPPTLDPSGAPPAYITALRSSSSKRARHSSRGQSTLSPLDALTPDDELTSPSNVARLSSSNNDVVGATDELDADGIDWAFWDQLIRDPDAMLMGNGVTGV